MRRPCCSLTAEDEVESPSLPVVHRQRNFPTPRRAKARQGCPTKQQVGAAGEQLPADYNRNREQTRHSAGAKARAPG